MPESNNGGGGPLGNDDRSISAQLRIFPERYKVLFERSPAGFYVATIDGRVLDCNDAFAKMLGYASRGEVLAKAQPVLSIPDETESERAGGQSETRLRTRSGGDVWVLRSEMLADPKGQGLRLGTLVDITERKRAEQALRDSERKYAALVEEAPVGIVRFDADARLEFVNPAAERMLGQAGDDMTGRHFADLGVIPPEELPAMFDEFAALLVGEPRAPSEWELVRRDGTRLTIEASGRPVAEGGRIVAVQVILRDVTQRRREDVRRRELEEQLLQAQKMDAVGRLAGGIAHDFNNLLSVILNYTSILLREIKEHDPIHEDLREVARAAERGAALTRRLLTFSRKDVVRPTIVDVNETITEMERLLVRALGEHVELVTVLDAVAARTLVDPGQIEQIITNLAINARDAMPRGGRLTIETTNVDLDDDPEPPLADLARGRYVRILITDSGAGMSEAIRVRAFEPFFTTKPKDKGTGLGLATVYGIVQQAKGRIVIHSQEGAGTTMEILLPTTDETPTGRLRTIRRAPHPGRGETVLVTEDEDALRTMTSRLLSRSGYTVLEARGPGEALLASERHGGKIDLLLTDVVMPQMSGKELADRLVVARPEMRVMYMSGYANEIVAQQIDDGRRVPLLEKPFTEEILLARVREVLDE